MRIFVHIPKTAGSALNDFFSKIYDGNVISHYELRQHRIKHDAFLKGKNFPAVISGHLPYDTMVQLFATSGERLVCCSVVRDPIKRLVSHIRWQSNYVIEGTHDVSNQIIAYYCAAFLRNPSLSNLSRVLDMRSALSRSYFNNIQSRFLISKSARQRFANLDEAKKRKIISREIQSNFDVVFLQDSIKSQAEDFFQATGYFSKVNVAKGGDICMAEIEDIIANSPLAKGFLVDDWIVYESAKENAKFSA